MKFTLLNTLVFFVAGNIFSQPRPEHNLVFPQIPARWDEALPLGNGLLGCLVWQRDGRLRLSLDRADLWDLRPMAGLDRPEFSYRWVAGQVAKGDYAIVQEYFDAPYEREAGPTKLPGAALEISAGDLAGAGCQLDISSGLATVNLSNGLMVKTFVHATRREGWFSMENVALPVPAIQLLPPPYSGDASAAAGGSVQGDDLARLGYRTGSVGVTKTNLVVYRQMGHGGFHYEVAVDWCWTAPGKLEGVWTIDSHFPQKTSGESAKNAVQKALKRGFDRSFEESKKWWAGFWAQSSVRLPDSLLERQYYRDRYKFGCTARADAPMISLQAVWTADNGRLPPWKGDLHHDLNTQMSYWPAYASNHPDEAAGYLRHLESNDAAHRAYTKRYFGTSGLNVPGVETLLGEPMGGWIQYACSPTTSAWLAQHFYLHWRYTGDRRFLRHHAWPWFRAVATHLEEISFLDQNGTRQLPLSSSPEIGDNSLHAWFPNTWTNYDLALAVYVFQRTVEIAELLGLPGEAEHWRRRLAELPPLAVDDEGALLIAPGHPQRESHRHFSHLMAIYPLGLLNWHEGPFAQQAIRASLARLDSAGTGGWTGYSFAWLACLRARARDGDGARNALRIFAGAFVSPNSFHLNGDQSGKGYSNHTYRPFTLEGNFAFAAGVQEMLLQSEDGLLDVFPAVPADWTDVSFDNLRAEGAILVGATAAGGRLREVRLRAERDTDWFLLRAGTEADAKKFQLKKAELADFAPQYGAWWVKMRAGGTVVFQAD